MSKFSKRAFAGLIFVLSSCLMQSSEQAALGRPVCYRLIPNYNACNYTVNDQMIPCPAYLECGPCCGLDKGNTTAFAYNYGSGGHTNYARFLIDGGCVYYPGICVAGECDVDTQNPQSIDCWGDIETGSSC
jgi:hypothetical protein